jgi:hypothetical protein
MVGSSMHVMSIRTCHKNFSVAGVEQDCHLCQLVMNSRRVGLECMDVNDTRCEAG